MIQGRWNLIDLHDKASYAFPPPVMNTDGYQTLSNIITTSSTRGYTRPSSLKPAHSYGSKLWNHHKRPAHRKRLHFCLWNWMDCFIRRWQDAHREGLTGIFTDLVPGKLGLVTFSILLGPGT